MSKTWSTNPNTIRDFVTYFRSMKSRAGEAQSRKMLSAHRASAQNDRQLTETQKASLLAIYDQVVYYSSYEWMSFRLPQILITVASTTIIAGFGTPALTKALAATGVLDRFAAGRARELV